MTRVPRGRPKKERIQKENSRGKRGLNRDDVRPLADIIEVDGELLVRPSRSSYLRAGAMTTRFWLIGDLGKIGVAGAIGSL
ncbi:hypothetical protein VE00_02694 [Pseudogymnoascus sp. WSF 3629]|nr:hypothetical protein VE00_02694 [Pseudogymnoascus sp. WSF 3629]